MLLRLAPAGCFAVDCDDRLVASATLLSYGASLAWLGMVLTLPAYRGRGFARALVEHALAYADHCRIAAVKLDATQQGLPLYKTLGFREEEPIERWVAHDIVAAPAAIGDASLTGEQVVHMDSHAFGVPRPELIQSLLSRGRRFTCADGFLLSRPGAVASYLGPCVAQSESSARKLVVECLRQSGGSWFWDLLPANPRVVAMAQALGFQRARQLVRMVRGNNVASERTRSWAIAGFEIG